MRTVVTLSLISHTNVGKTTLARTLLRRDVGEVQDREHVTEESESFTLIETDDALLRLWDTPGFGNSATLMKLLRRQSSPLGWLLHQAWDRVVNRPLFCSQQAAANVKEEADVVLYLVNAAEAPEDAGYVALELELLAWIGRPVLVLLNQVGPEGTRIEPSWRAFFEDSPIVRAVGSLDAFTRCWIEEDLLMRRVVELLDGDKRRAMESLRGAWDERNRHVYRASVDRLAAYLTEAATDHETPSTNDADGRRSIAESLKFTTIDKRKAMKRLNARLDRSTARLMEDLIAGYGLEGSSVRRIERRVQDFQVRGDGIQLNERSGAIAGAVVSGALSGLAADVLSGGLTLGGGMIAGGILGALGGAAIGRGYRMVGGGESPSVRWSVEFLDRLTAQAVLRYLAVAHYGRGRGAFRDLEEPAYWSPVVERALAPRLAEFRRLWDRETRDDGGESLRRALTPLVRRVIDDVLAEAYPEAGRT